MKPAGLVIYRRPGESIEVTSRTGERMRIEALEGGGLRFVGRRSAFRVIRAEIVGCRASQSDGRDAEHGS